MEMASIRCPFTLFNDEPTLVDKLQRAESVATAGEAIASCSPPQVFGVHGEWGCGKTSFLHQLHLYLTGDCPQQPDSSDRHKEIAKDLWGDGWKAKDKARVVWFEAWRYQYEQVPIVALLQEIRSQLSWQLKLGRQLSKETQVAIQSALLAFEDLTKKIGIQASKIQEVGEKWEQQQLAYVLPSDMTRRHLEHAIELLLGKGKKTGAQLVVLVDDLDRCESETAYRLLEGIKIYLNLPNCVFVLGMNQQVIESAVGKHLPGNSGSNGLMSQAMARTYIDKLCQNIYYVPTLESPCDYLCTLLAEAGGQDVAGRIAICLQNHDCLPANSRKVKSLANTLLRFIGFVCLTGDKPLSDRDVRLLVVMAYLYQCHHNLYRMLEVKPEFYNLIRQWAEGLPVEHELFKGLELPLVAGQADPTAPTLEPILTDAFKDPVHESIFRVQSLIRQLGDVQTSEIKQLILR